MNSSRTHRNLAIGIAIIAIFIGVQLMLKKSSPAYQYTIGIIQTVSHPALDAARQGFTDYLTEKLGTRINFVVKNAQANPAQAHLIAQSFQADPALQGIFAIATMALQASLHLDSNRPLVFAAVTDPKSAGVPDNATHICGASDKLDAVKQVDLLAALVPHARTVVLFYNISESNAQITAKNLQNELIKRDYQVKTFTITQQSDIPLIIDRALQAGDVLMTPIDNTVATAISFIANKAIEAKKPFLVSDNLLVKQGALAGAGVDYYALGKQAGVCTYNLLTKTEKFEKFSVFEETTQQVMINDATRKKIGLPEPALPVGSFTLIS